MAEERDDEIEDLRKEETSRGRKQPKTAESLERLRRIRKLARMLADPDCDQRTYMEAIRAFGFSDESAEFRELLALWQKSRGGS